MTSNFKDFLFIFLDQNHAWGELARLAFRTEKWKGTNALSLSFCLDCDNQTLLTLNDMNVAYLIYNKPMV
jgi:hypothetical protein